MSGGRLLSSPQGQQTVKWPASIPFTGRDTFSQIYYYTITKGKISYIRRAATATTAAPAPTAALGAAFSNSGAVDEATGMEVVADGTTVGATVVSVAGVVGAWI